jgi:hypothetical protein
VHPRFDGQQPDGRRRNVGDVSHQNIDATLQRRGQRFIEIAFVYLTAVSAEISASTPNRDRIDIDRMHIDRGQRHG